MTDDESKKKTKTDDEVENTDDSKDEADGDSKDEADGGSEDEEDRADSEEVVESTEKVDGEPSAWDEKMKLAVQLWDTGNNARLREVLLELEKAPKEETAVHTLIGEYRRRLKPDPVAIGLWVLTLCVFCLLTYLFVIR